MSSASAASARSGGHVNELSPAELVSAQRANLLGPYDLPWLLERVADFGSEDPTWRSAEHTVAGKAESPPNPVQLLIPEMVLFDSAGRGVPSALFFTDRGGFLRAVRRPLRKEPPVIYDTLLQLMKQRHAIDAGILKENEAELSKTSSSIASKHLQAQEMDSVGLSCTPEVEAKVAEASGSSGSPKRREPKSPAVAGKGWQAQQRKGAWSLSVCGPGGTEQHRLTDAEVSKHFGATGDGRAVRWPVGARLLQACFWLGTGSAPGGSYEGGERLCSYRYDALETEVPGAEHTGLEAIVTNHFERFSFLDAARDRNRMSAVPNLLAQHLSYYCNLELVTGDFMFFKDRRAQLWLVEAKNLYFLPNVVRTVAGQAAATNEALPQKLFRYLSEEALQMMPVDDVTGTKCQEMLEQMLDHYQGIKAQHNVDALLRKEQEDMDTNIPVLEGTNMHALVQKFEVTGLSDKLRDGKAGTPQKRNYRVVAPKQRLPLGRGRWFSAEAASEVARARQHVGELRAPNRGREELKLAWQQYKEEKKHREEKSKGENMGQLLEYQVYRTMWSRQNSPRAPASARSRPETANSNRSVPDSVSINSESAASRATSRGASKGRSSRRQGPRARMFGSSKASESGAPQPKIEIVSTPQAQSLLLNAGTGICPEGPTLDGLMREGHLARTPGLGLVMCRKAAAPRTRAVDVPPGAAGAALARVSARVREAEAEAEAAAGKAAALARGVATAKCAEGGGGSAPRGAAVKSGKSDAPAQSVSLTSTIGFISIPGGAATEPEGADAADKNDGAVTARAVKRIVGPDGVNGHPSLAGFLAAPV